MPSTLTTSATDNVVQTGLLPTKERSIARELNPFKMYLANQIVVAYFITSCVAYRLASEKVKQLSTKHRDSGRPFFAWGL